MEQGQNQEHGWEHYAQAFVDARARPAVFLFPRESLGYKHAFALRTQFGKEEFPELDLVINSGGGNIHAAYQIISLLRRHADRIHACVPFFAKSAATLLCVGSDTIFLDELAQLGPLDPQIYEQKEGGKSDFTSALNPFKTLEQLQKFSLESLDIAMSMIVRRSGMNVDECLRHATRFVKCTTEPLFSQLNPEKLGEYSRELAVGVEYGKRLMGRLGRSDDNSSETIDKLVHGYPSHGYIIDYDELHDMGFDVHMFLDSEHDVVQELRHIVAHNVVQLVLPSETETAEPKEAGQESAES